MAGEKTNTAEPKENEALVRRYIEAVCRGDHATLGELLSEDIAHDFSRDGIHLDLGRGSAVAWAKRAGRVDVEVLDLFASDDKVVGRYRFRIPGDVVLGGKKGVSAQMTGIMIARIADGKIVEVWHEQDTLGMLLALGLAIVPMA
ncbi:MAG TPA: nuclear transport factor 2 family protein [Polyangium sp.]|nr:nuclear transport factor 2 family protein [Polyangium sp.]